MNMKRHAITLMLAILLVACDREQPPEPTAPEPPPAAEAAPESSAAAEADESTAEASPQAVENQAVTESAADDAVDDSEVQSLLAAAMAGEPSQSATRDWQYSAGKHYSELTAAQGTATGAGGIEVTEVFWYGCPHCYSFDPYLERWEQDLPEDVRFVRVPVMWNPTNEIHARVFYTAEALGKLGEMHDAIFRAFHQQGKTLTREDEIRDFFGEFGVSGEEFDKTFRSFAVESKLKRAKSLTQRYRVRSVPVLVVNGKYITDGPEVKSFEDMIAVADELVERERSEM